MVTPARHTEEDSDPVDRVGRRKGWRRGEVKAGLPPRPPGNWPLEGRAGYRGPGLALSLSWVNLPHPEQRLGPDLGPTKL